MKPMAPSQRTGRLAVQRVGDNRRPLFRVVVDGVTGARAHAEFPALSALLDALDDVVPDVVLDLPAKGSVTLAGAIGSGRRPTARPQPGLKPAHGGGIWRRLSSACTHLDFEVPMTCCRPLTRSSVTLVTKWDGEFFSITRSIGDVRVMVWRRGGRSQAQGGPVPQRKRIGEDEQIDWKDGSRLEKLQKGLRL
jgi:hypothetical protein